MLRRPVTVSLPPRPTRSRPVLSHSARERSLRRHRDLAALALGLTLLVASPGAAVPPGPGATAPTPNPSAAALAAPVHVRGRALAISGKVLPAGTRVELYPRAESYAAALRRLETRAEEAPLASATAGPDGSFDLAAPEPGCYRLLVRAEGHVPVEHSLFPLVEEVSAEELPAAALRPASSLEVQVLGRDGKPAGGIDLQAFAEATGEEEWPVAWGPAVRRATTGPDGWALVPRGHGEKLQVIVTSPLFLGESMVVEPAQDRAVLRLAPRGTVRLQIRGADGKPAARALLRMTGSPGDAFAVAGAEGRIDVATSFAAEPLPILAEDAAGGLAEVLLPREAGRGEVILVSLRPFEIMTGRVLDARTRQPLPGAVV